MITLLNAAESSRKLKTFSNSEKCQLASVKIWTVESPENLFLICIVGEVVVSEVGNPNSYIAVQQLKNQESSPAATTGRR